MKMPDRVARASCPHNTVLVQFNHEELKRQVAELATEGVFVGTSSWKYQGWFGTLYDRARYEYRGRFAQSRF
jgi:hypothetical protein